MTEGREGCLLHTGRELFQWFNPNTYRKFKAWAEQFHSLLAFSASSIARASYPAIPSLAFVSLKISTETPVAGLPAYEYTFTFPSAYLFEFYLNFRGRRPAPLSRQGRLAQRGKHEHERNSHSFRSPFRDIRTRAVDGTELLTEGSFTEHHVQVWSPPTPRNS
ncbi:hypothetical protein QYF36_023727 [Acer negundo]|nr:hypothetical protein QYF36_023727 [Acer negundo]